VLPAPLHCRHRLDLWRAKLCAVTRIGRDTSSQDLDRRSGFLTSLARSKISGDTSSIVRLPAKSADIEDRVFDAVAMKKPTPR